MQALVRCMQAEVIALEITYVAQLSTYLWQGLGPAPWITKKLRKLAGQADIRSVPVDWRGIVAELRRRGWTGKLPRSMRRYEPPDDFVKPWPEWPGDPPWYNAEA